MKTKLTKWMWVLGVMLSVSAYAQERPKRGPEGREKLEAAKVGIISERLGLTTEQAQQFWPIYNEYSQRRRENRQAFREQRKGFNRETASEDETKALLELGRETKAKELELDQEYSNRMLKVIDNKQLLSLQEAERDFKQKLLRRLEQRRPDRPGRPERGELAPRPNQNMQERQRRENVERMRNKRSN